MAVETEDKILIQPEQEPPRSDQPMPAPIKRVGGQGKIITSVLALVIFVAMFFLASFRSGEAIDINHDEATYAIESVAFHRTGMTLWNAQPFFVHPPLFFVIEGIYFKALGIGESPLFSRLLERPIVIGEPLLTPEVPLSSDNLYNAILAGRYLSVVYGALIATLLFLLGSAFFNRWASLLAALLFMLDPYVIRRTHFNMLEPLATLFGVLLVAAYFLSLRKDNWRERRPWLIAAGVLFGLALLSKELALIYFPALALHALLFRRDRLKELLLPLVTGLAVYSLFPLWAALSGSFDIWWQSKTWLFRRITGSLQDTGIARPGTSVARSFNTSLYDYWPSFVLLGAAGLIALLVLYLHFRRGLRDTPFELLSALIIGCYAFFGAVVVLGGVINEQFFYVLMPFVMMTVAYAVVAGPYLLTRHAAGQSSLVSGAGYERLRVPVRTRLAQLTQPVIFLGMAALLAFMSFAWVQRYVLSTDNSFAQIEGYLNQVAPPGSSVVGRDPLDFYLLPKSVVYAVSFLSDFGNPVVPMDIAERKIPYAILNDQALYERYHGANVPYYDWVQRNGSLNYTFPGRLWNTYVYSLDYSKPIRWDTIGADSMSVGKPAVASSTEDVSRYPAQRAFDSIASTRWSSLESDPQWIYVDLGQSTNISRVTLAWERAYARSYELQVSENGSDWTSFYSTESGKGAYEVVYASANGRYVRLWMTQRGTRYGYSLWELSVYP
ncbi:MAG: discoidin domain-containing protein [Chloroflexia bacterium]